MFKYLLIDLDGTLLDFNKGERKAFIKTMKEICKYIPNEDEILLFSKINEECFQEFSKNNISRAEFHHLRFKRILEELNIKADIKAANDYYVNALKYNAEVYDDAKECLEYLYNKYDLYVASNGMKLVQDKRLELAGLKKYIKKNYISEECGANKPDIEFFNYIFKDLNDYDKSKYVIIGDRLDADIIGGINAGIKTIYINRNDVNNDIKPDYEIKDLRDIKRIL